MQKRPLRVCLVDLDLYLGDVLSFLDISGSYSITDVLANMTTKNTADFFKRLLNQGTS